MLRTFLPRTVILHEKGQPQTTLAVESRELPFSEPSSERSQSTPTSSFICTVGRSLFRSSSRSAAVQRLRRFCVVARLLRSCVRVTDRGYALRVRGTFLLPPLSPLQSSHARRATRTLCRSVSEKREKGYYKITMVFMLKFTSNST